MSDQSAADHDEVSVAAPPMRESARDDKAEKNAVKVERVKTQLKKSKPANSSHPVWKYFKAYQSTLYQGLAVCELCVASGNFHMAEVKNKGGSPTNLMSHLNTQKPGHKDAHKEIEDRLATASTTAAGSTAAAAAAATRGKLTAYYVPEETTWLDELVRLIVNNYLALSFVDYPELKALVARLNKKAVAPTRRALLSKMNATKKGLETEVALMLDGEFVAITTDGWTSRSNDSYMSLTVAYIDSQWELHHLSLDCTKHTGTTTGEDLAKLIVTMIERHDLTGRVVACVTDCEPSMVKAGRLLEVGGEMLQHIGCSNHRMESTTSSVFNGKSLGTLALARALVGRYKKSSQMAARLAELCGILKMEVLCVMQDVETRWWSSWSMIERLLYLMKAIKLHESMDDVNSLLSVTDWEVLRLIEPILAPFMKAQKDLEGAQYVTGSMTIPKIAELRDGLEAAISALKDVARTGLNDATKQAMQAVLPDAEALWEDFKNRWGDGYGILEYKEGKRRQPQGFKLQQVFATALDPRAKHLYGIRAGEHADVWRAVANKAVETALEKYASDKPPASAEKPAAAPVQTPPILPGGHRGPKRPRLSPFEAAAAAHAADAAASSVAGESTDEKREQLATIVDLEVAAFKTAPGLAMWDMKAEKKIFNNPLEWWRRRQLEFPLLASLARRVLAIPSSQAQSERMFSTAGLTVTPTRNCLSDESVELLVYLRNVWGVVDDWKKSAARRHKTVVVS